MKAWKVWAGAGLLLFGVSALLPAQGLYVLGGIGGKTVYDQDVSDYYGGSIWGAQEVGLFDGALSLGWRFPGIMGLEASVTEDGGQSNSAYLGGGYSSTLDYGPMTTVALGPVFCFDHPSWWWWIPQTGVTEIGLKLEYAGVSGSESVSTSSGPGSQDFSASGLGVGVFVRDLNIWTPGGFSLGIELGWDDNYFPNLTLSDTSGYFAGHNGQTLTQYGGGNAYLDNSGGYVRLVLGWTQHPRRLRPVPRRRPYWRRRAYYDDDGDGDGDGAGQAGDGAPGDTIPPQPQAQPVPQAAPQASPQQTYPDSQNYGN